MRIARVIVSAMTCALAGCVLFVDPIETNDHCSIAGGGGACATCISNACVKEIDACCASNECAGSTILSDIDKCGNAEADACSATMTFSRLTKTEEAVRFCASASCRAVCTEGATGIGPAPRVKWTCSTPREATNDCATCIYAQCGARLSTCCSDSQCASSDTIATDLGACLTADTRGCAYATNVRGNDGQAGAVRACIRDECAAKCIGDGTTHTKCSLSNGGKYCECTPSEIPGDQPCTANEVGGDCVQAANGCSCGRYGCSGSTLGCTCDFEGSGTGTTTCNATESGTVCCLKVSGGTYGRSVECSCESFSKCYGADVEVTSCDRGSVLAALGSSVVKSCSR